jgi:predicted nucleic acid-binding protein
VARALGGWQAIVPAIWPLEVANTLVMGERRGRSTARQAAVFLELLRALPITIDHAGATAAWTETLDLARRFRLSAYDAAYLELAVRQDADLATRDRSLVKAATAAGVSLFQLPKS